MIALKPGALSVRQLLPVDQPLVEGDERQRFELQPAFPAGMGRHVVIRRNHIEVLEADTAPALFVIARLIRHHHTWLERLVTAPCAQTLWPFVDVEKGTDAVPSAMPIVETGIPHVGARQGIQDHTTRAFGKFLPGQGNMTAEDERVQATLTLRRRADTDGTRVIRSAPEHLHPGVDQEKFAIAERNLRTCLAIMHDGAVGSSRGNGREAEITKPLFTGIFLVQHGGIGEFADALSSGELAFETRQAPDLGTGRVPMGVAHRRNLHRVFYSFHQYYRIARSVQ